MESERVKATRESIGGLATRMKQPPGITEDMYKPLIFGNHQFHFKVFNFLVCLGKGEELVPNHTPFNYHFSRNGLLLCIQA